ncbi:HRDC domain-containing protein [Desulfoluna spongiiphila]|uniref:HRDC domain-containing protein n=1 Tax=Desulfoluna spongiiphila TaxID=419481 RepID=A0A1G5ER42_9BACT|nr:HRDC domain-containing protein [Desulfoluna spongiiphila]SCY29467.1 HRDC domain-containing protein [Desulfoluna spongiiphila]
MHQNNELELAFEFVQGTQRNLFLTGKAGTGKTTFLHRVKEEIPKRMVVVAPTGVAAINAGGTTIHSFFQMPFGPLPPDTTLQNRRFSKKKIHIIQSLDLLVIDEISMVRADLLDGIDQVLRRYRDRTQPFGGVQLLMIGDLHQLAPIIKPDDWELLSPYYETGYFFSSRAFQEASVLGLELTHVYRQSNEAFIKILNEIRENRLSEASREQLNTRYKPSALPGRKEGYITLTTHNASADRLNDEKLAAMDSPVVTFDAEVTGTFPEYAYPADELLQLKEGAQVMFVKNDSSSKKEYYNGKIGTVTEIDDEVIHVQCEGQSPITVNLEKWENITYTLNEETKEIDEEVVGSFSQYPLRLAWAITIHKSQGLTFEKAVIDAGASFAHGQTYVALSRCKTLEGIVLSSRISPSGIICDASVNQFTRAIEENPPTKQDLSEARRTCQFTLLDELFGYQALHEKVSHCHTTLHHHKNAVQGTLLEALTEILSTTLPEFTRIAGAFSRQVASLMEDDLGLEENEVIQDRIRKGCAYFSEQTRHAISERLDEATFETDNQSVKTLIGDALVAIREELIVKETCLKGCKEGFRVETFLSIRTRAFFKRQSITARAKAKVKSLSSEHPRLLNQLRDWRKQRAARDDINPSRVATLSSLVTISTEHPDTMAQLRTIQGMGAKRVKTYGAEIIEIVRAYSGKGENKTRTGIQQSLDLG